jgi:PAS domain S-box-containing protein
MTATLAGARAKGADRVSSAFRLHSIQAMGRFYNVLQGITTEEALQRAAEAEEALRRAHEELEARVAERTRELREANANLKAKIAEQARADEALRESNDRFRTLVQNIRDYAIFMLDPRGFVTEWTEGAERVKGYTAQEAIGQHVSIFFTPEDIAAGEVEREFEQAAKEGRAEREAFRVRKGGERFWANEIATAIRDAEGALVGFTKISRDLSERKRMQDALAETEERHRIIVENARDFGIFMTDPEGRVSTWNSGAQRIFGYTEPEILGRSAAVLFTPEDVAKGEHDRELATAAREGRASDDRWQMRKDGSRFWASGVTASVRDGQGKLRGFTKVLRDLTETKQLEEQRERMLALEQEARQAAEAAIRIKDEFIATVSHELRTPLSAVLLWAKMLRSGRVQPQDQEEALRSIVQSAEAQKELIEDLLDVSRMISGKLRLNVREIELSPVLRAALDAVLPTARAKGVQLKALGDLAGCCGSPTQEPSKELCVRGDPDRLRQVVLNLLTNAVKFTPAGGHVELSVQRALGTARVIVRDTGQGIPPEFLPHVFDRFRQADAGMTRSHGGLGLGLAIVRELVELHGGRVWAESDGEGKGATFTVELPLLACSGEAAAGGDEELADPTLAKEKDASKLLAGLRVLLVEDDPETRRALAWAIETSGAHVTAVDTADAAFHELERSSPDVLVSDIGLPVEDGCSLLRRARAAAEAQNRLFPPALALSAYARLADRERALEVGCDRCMAKPVDPDELINEVASLSGRLA